MVSNIEWWWELINTSEDFKSMPPDTQKRILERLQQCTAHFNSIALSLDKIKELVNEVGPTAVFDAIIVSWTWPDKYKNNPYMYLAQLKKEIVRNFLLNRTLKTIVHKEPNNPHKTGHPVDLEYVKKKNPLKVESENNNGHKRRGCKRSSHKI